MSIGLPLKRVDAEAKVTGSARYTDDNIMLGMRHAKYVRSNIAHGKVLAIDATEALALHGVEAVFTHEDVPTTCFRTAGHAWSLDEAKRDVKDRRLLTDHVRHFGDGVAIVVARDRSVHFMVLLHTHTGCSNLVPSCHNRLAGQGEGGGSATTAGKVKK